MVNSTSTPTVTRKQRPAAIGRDRVLIPMIRPTLVGLITSQTGAPLLASGYAASKQAGDTED
jgi:hypothetical protein